MKTKARIYKEAPDTWHAKRGQPWACHVTAPTHDCTIRHRTWEGAMLDARVTLGNLASVTQ